MSQENVKMLQSGYDAFRRGDLPAIFKLFDPDIEFYQSQAVPWGGRYKGLDQVKEFFHKLTTAIASQVELDHFVDAGDCVVAVGRTRGTVRATGKAFNVPVVHVWRLKDGKAIRFEAYIDHPSMLRALQSQGS